MWPYPKIVAHRGGGKLAPENTLAALRCGLAYGFRAVEFDVMLASDGVPVVVHDPELGRTVKGAGAISDYPGAQLAAMDAGSWFGPDFIGEPLPLFSQFLDYCGEQRIWMNIEIKPAPGVDAATGTTVAAMVAERFTEELAAGLATTDPVRLPLLSSFSFAALAAARDAAPGVPRAFLVEQVPADWRAQLETLGAVALHTDHNRLTQAQAQAIRAAGYGLFCYTVNDPARARELLGWGVDGFCTDRIDLIGPAFA
jgi:glycerophosphoryl diester phosphodiesterase